MTARITSSQKRQFRRFVEDAGNRALKSVALDKDGLQRLFSHGGEFQAYVVAGISRFSSGRHPAAELLEKYFQDVYGRTLDLTKVQFPNKKEFTTWMAVPAELDEDTIMERVAAYFRVKSYVWRTPIAANINRKLAQKRPQGLYVLAHSGGDEPDDVHRNKSYDDAMAQNLTFLNPKEYLLVNGFHNYTKRYFMDRKGWTRISSLWSDGCLVHGDWDDAGAELCLRGGLRDSRDPGGGPREAVLA